MIILCEARVALHAFETLIKVCYAMNANHVVSELRKYDANLNLQRR